MIITTDESPPATTTNAAEDDLPSPSIIYDFAPQPRDAHSDDSNPRGWSLQRPQPRKQTMGPVNPLPPEGPKGTSLTSSVAEEKPWYKIRETKPRAWGRKADSDLELFSTRGGRVLKGRGDRICSCKFDKDRVICGIYGPDGRAKQTIGHEYAPKSRYRCKSFAKSAPELETKDLFWQTLGPSQTVLELVDEASSNDEKRGADEFAPKRFALFVYTSDPAQQMDPVSGRRKPLRRDEIGELWFVDTDPGWAAILERAVQSLIVVLEMRATRRR